MARGVHAVVQNPHNDDAGTFDPKIDHVPIDRPSTVARAYVIAGRGQLRRRRKIGERRREKINVAISLGWTPG